MSPDADFLVLGAGIAGASVAWHLAARGRVVVLEREPLPGYHSTGRSAAMFIEGYGPAQVRALTRASRAFLESPPDGFCDVPILSPRGVLMVAPPGREEALDAHAAVLAEHSGASQRLDPAQACALVPALRRETIVGATFEPEAADIDVDALHQGLLRGIARCGSNVVCGAEVQALTRAAGRWHARTPRGTFSAPVVLNAAGAWADAVGALAGAASIGLQPRRRSAFTFDPPEGCDVRRWPTFGGIDEDWYAKPDAGRLLGSPANADPVPPHDVQAEELDVATGIHRIEAMTTLRIRRPRRVWAGLRSFVADGELVGGWDARAEGFLWVAGQGGYGIQTCAAMGEACAALAAGDPLPARLAGFGVSLEALSPARLAAHRG